MTSLRCRGPADSLVDHAAGGARDRANLRRAEVVVRAGPRVVGALDDAVTGPVTFRGADVPAGR
jgi:hypothetical protein